MVLEAGAALEVRVTGISKFGAFVSLPDGRSGLVHISEISSGYVNDVSDHLSVGQTVKAVVVSIAPDGKINLSIKPAQSAAAVKAQPRQENRPRSAAQAQPVNSDPGKEDFEDKLKKFMRESDSRIADNRMYSEHRQRSRRR